MTINTTQKISLLAGGISGLYLGLWASLSFFDYSLENHEYWDNLDNNQTNQHIALFSTFIAPLTMLTGAHFGLTLGSMASLPKSQVSPFMRETRQHFFNFFGLPNLFDSHPKEEKDTKKYLYKNL